LSVSTSTVKKSVPTRTSICARYGDVLREYKYHPEAKCANADGIPCGKQTVGLLQRRHIRIDEIKYIGKESNSLEEIESGLNQTEENVYTYFPDPRRDDWETKKRLALKNAPLPILEKESGMSRRMLIYARTGRRRPHPTNQKRLAEILHKLGLV
jgi:hypothetical protein